MTSSGLERGWRKARLIRELAGGEKNQVELAKEFGATQPTISRFNDRHSDEIAAMRDKLDDQWATLWVADRYNRVAEMQGDIEEIGQTADDKLLKAKHAAFRQIAEELGQLREHIDVTGKLTYVVEGIDLKALQ